jgi:hypothetical protein
MTQVEAVGDEEADALRTAIDSSYPELRKRYDKGEKGDFEVDLDWIEQMFSYYIGLEVGRRVSRE